MGEAHQPKTPTAAATGPAQGELPQTLGECHAVIDPLRAQLGQLQEQVMTLQERLKLDSSNSSKPPSSYGPGSGNRAQRRASTRKRGAQMGHKGHYRALLDEQEVQQITDCKPAEVCECGTAVAAVADEHVMLAPMKQMDETKYPREGGGNWAWGVSHRKWWPTTCCPRGHAM